MNKVLVQVLLLGCIAVVPMAMSETALATQQGRGGSDGSEGVVTTSPATGGLPAGNNSVDKLSPFRENWILSELRSIRSDMMQYRNDMNLLVTDRELEVADKAMSYADSTVTYFFYLIAGAASLLALVGWTTIRDLKDKIRGYAEAEMARLTGEYESRLEGLEQELRSKSRTIAANQEEIERTNEIHSLWLKASKEVSPQAKMVMYDRILELRPDDHEALAWKADTVLELGEQRWALNLCDKVLAIDPKDAHALYQRACAWVGLDEPETALSDLDAALHIMPSLKDAAVKEEHFAPLRDLKAFQELLAAHHVDAEPSRQD
jgi:tetratricopeptide (TPR) repeat protein